MTISYLLTTIAIVIAAAIPYKAFTNWRKSKANENLRKTAEKFSLSIVNSDPPSDFPLLQGTVDKVFIKIETTKTKDGGKYPITHITVSLKPEFTEGPDIVKILPNRSFMATPDEIYLKTGKTIVDNLYLIGVPRAELAKKLEQLAEDKDQNKDNEVKISSTKETEEISSIEPLLVSFLEDGVKLGLHEGQFLFKQNSIKYSAPEHPVSKESLERLEFLINKLPELTRQAVANLLFK